MKDSEDAWGHALLDFLGGYPAQVVHERDDGYVMPSEVAPFFAEVSDWSRAEQEALAYVRGNVLDVGCGAGRHALYLQDQGFNCVAIDSSPGAIEVCRRRGVIDARVLPLDHVSASLGTFNTVQLFFGGFGLFATRPRAQRALRRLHQMTTPDALIIAESVDPHVTDGPEDVRYIERNRKKRRMPGQLTVRSRYRAYSTPWEEWLNASPAEIDDLVEGTGWYVWHRIAENASEFIVFIAKAH